ncbi:MULTISPECIES: hypothetical protein [Protofrankia]|uniref:hypothetical protein n=1 Tax=Protofrankia TaxID=2994361 RepID=UPI00069A0D6E|nr:MULTISPECIES: hypothetical protein [Protofrankia]ONH34335.1 hypothetical protein BL254_16680 [Protofrankia sp. BMG5.30]
MRGNSILRVPPRAYDPPLHHALDAALGEAGARPKIGRPAGTAQDTIVEVGSNPLSWTVLPADQIAETDSARVHAIPFDPPLTIVGSVITSEDTPSHAAACAVAAFRDATGTHDELDVGNTGRQTTIPSPVSSRRRS